MFNVCGIIYKYTNIGDNIDYGMVYIGQTRCASKRRKQHTKEHVLNEKNVNTKSFHYALSQYGDESFIYEILEEKIFKNNDHGNCLNECCVWMNEREKFYINENDSYINGYNLTRGGGGTMSNNLLLIKYDYIFNEYVLPLSKKYHETEGNLQCIPNNFDMKHKDKKFNLGRFITNIRRKNTTYVKYNKVLNEKFDIDLSKSVEYSIYEIIIYPCFKWFYNKNGHLDIPGKYIVPKTDELEYWCWGTKIGCYLNTIRCGHKKIVLNNDDELKKLQEIGYYQNHYDFLWEKKLKPSFQIYYDEKNNLNVRRSFCVPKDHPNKLIAGFKLGEEVHKIRSNGMFYIFDKPERKKWLFDRKWVGKSNDSDYPNIRDRTEREKIVLEKEMEFLRWFSNEYGHCNISQNVDPNSFENLPDYIRNFFVQNKLKMIGFISHIRNPNSSWKKNHPQEYSELENLNLFKSEHNFWNHKFKLGMEWFFKHSKLQYPSQGYKIPESESLPKYMIDFNLGTMLHNRKRRSQLNKEFENILQNREKNTLYVKPTNWKVSEDTDKNVSKNKQESLEKNETKM